MYLLKEWWVSRNIKICDGIEATLHHELQQNAEARKAYMRKLEDLRTEERHRIINGALENK